MGDKSGRTVILTSSDDKQIEVPVEVASLSVTLKHMIEGTFYDSFFFLIINL